MNQENKNRDLHSQSKESNQDHCCADKSDSQIPLSKLNAADNEVLTTFKVANMDCADEIKAISDVLKIEGIFKVQANLITSTVQIIHSPKIHSHLLKKKIETTVVRILDEDHSKTQNHRSRVILVITSGALLAIGLLLQWIKLIESIADVLFFCSILSGGILVFPKAYSSIKRKSLDMNVLMTIAITGAVLIKEFSEASAVVFLFSLSELLESLSVQRARNAIQALLKITPENANLIQKNGTLIEVNVNEIELSKVIRVKAGEKIPLDGIVLSGQSSVNQAPLTGESIPIAKSIGESVFAGTINQEGSLDIKVTKLYSDTKISQVIRLVEEAQSQRAVSQKFVERFAAYYTPIVIVLAILTFLIPVFLLKSSTHEWFYKSLVFLVIACPCALVISTPVSIVSSLTSLARKGVLVKGGAVLEVLGKIRALALDKTGTLTEGKPKVQNIIRFNSHSEVQILEIAKALEVHSNHPLAIAIVDSADQQDVTTKTIDKFITVTGRGVEAVIDGHTYLLGNHRFAHDVGICTPQLEQTLQELEDQSLSVVVVGHKPHDDCQGEVIGVIALGDNLRKDSGQVIQQLKQIGVEKIVVLSGDNQKTVNAIGKKLPLDDAHGDLLPEDKMRYIEDIKSKYNTVAMIGDGVNDAPAMAKASVGIAMGFIGSDTAIETADVTLMTDDLRQVAVAITAGRRTLKIVQFNIVFALLTKAIFLGLNFLGYTNLWLAVAADTGASLLVILNSLRLLK